MPNHSLKTRPLVARIKHPAKGTDFFSDPDLKTDPDAKGIRLAVGVRKKVWWLTRRMNGNVKQIRLGDWPMLVDVYAARSVAKAKLAEVTAHTDVLSTGINTLQDALDSHIAKSTASAETTQSYRDHVRINMPNLFSTPLEDITLDHLERTLRPFRDTHGDATATQKHLDQIIRMSFKRAAILRRIPNIAEGLDRVQYKPKTNKVSFAQDRWIALELISKKQSQNQFIGAAWELMLFTGLRAGNVIALRWDDVDLVKKRLKVARLKNGNSGTFPLAERVVAQLDTLPRISAWVFPQRDVSKHIYHPDRLESSGGFLRPHDCRRLFTTAARRAELPSYIISQLRGDVASDIQGLYDQGSASHKHANIIARQIEVECHVVPDLRVAS